MGIESLLMKLEGRGADTPCTPCNPDGVTEETTPILAYTLVTSVTPEKEDAGQEYGIPFSYEEITGDYIDFDNLEERAAIREFVGGYSRPNAERLAMQDLQSCNRCQLFEEDCVNPADGLGRCLGNHLEAWDGAWPRKMRHCKYRMPRTH